MEFPIGRYQIRILKEGQLKDIDDQVKVSSPIVLVQGRHNVLVGTGLPRDRDCLLQGFRDNNISPEQIEYVVCSHGSVDNVGNLNLFPNATHLIGCDIVKGDQQLLHEYVDPFEIDEDIEVISTPGHRPGGVVSVVVYNTSIGRVAVAGHVAIAGGVFHSEADLETPELWVDESKDSEEQQASRIHLLRVADHIVPRYGPFFRIPDLYKATGVPCVQTP